jgi:hypothetical protein
MLRQLCVWCLFLPIVLDATENDGTLGEYQRISSAHLGYDLQYRIYRPARLSSEDKLPTLYWKNP